MPEGKAKETPIRNSMIEHTEIKQNNLTDRVIEIIKLKLMQQLE